MLSIVGPGGIGKTAVALAVAEASVNTYEHGVWFVDLAPLANARLVPSALAQVLGFDIRSDDPVPGLVAALRDRRLLLVLDNCEHVIETQPLHAGLIILIPAVNRKVQQRLFKAALDELAVIGEPVNRVLEVDLDGEEVTLALYDLPPA